MKRFLNILLPWRVTIARLNTELSNLRVEKEVIWHELLEERAKRKTVQETFEQQKRGTATLLQFIHSTQRLGVPFSEGSIRAVLSNRTK